MKSLVTTVTEASRVWLIWILYEQRMNVTQHTHLTPRKVLAPEDFANPEDFVSSELRQLWTSSSNQIAGIQHYDILTVCNMHNMYTGRHVRKQ